MDGESRTIAIGVLKRLIGRLETEENPMNIIPVAVARSDSMSDVSPPHSDNAEKWLGQCRLSTSPVLMLKMFRKTERQSLYTVLDDVSLDGFITYNDFKLFIQQTDATKDPRWGGQVLCFLFV